MGSDKCFLQKQGVSWYQYMTDLFRSFTEHLYYSVNKYQIDRFPSGDNCIVDQYEDIGPYGGLLSSLELDVDAFWFCAVDLVDLEEEVLSKLHQSYLSNTNAVHVYKLEGDGFHPLCFIAPKGVVKYWEDKYSNQPMSIQRLLSDTNSNVMKVEITAIKTTLFRNYNSL